MSAQTKLYCSAGMFNALLVADHMIMTGHGAATEVFDYLFILNI